VSSAPDPVLVIGTTADYIKHISEGEPERAVFLTDRTVYFGKESPPGGKVGLNITAPLHDADRSFHRLQSSIGRWGINPAGVACFDCESLILASDVAHRLNLPFPSRRAVMNCRDKLVSRRLWREREVLCPKAVPVFGEEDIRASSGFMQYPVVVKPTALSGSELTFICENPDEAVRNMHLVRDSLLQRAGDRTINRDGMVDGRAMLCEEYIAGEEYSCDFISDGGRVKIARTARKHLRVMGPAGTVWAYEVPGMRRGEVDRLDLSAIIAEAAGALGLKRCMGMADFIIRDGKTYFLEVTPRPGGDCLPQVIKHSCGLDMLSAHLDFSTGLMPAVPPEDEWKRTVGLRVHAGRSGRLVSIRLRNGPVDNDILEIEWYRKPGDWIEMPPIDYSTWTLGHVIFRPLPGEDLTAQMERLSMSIEVEIE